MESCFDLERCPPHGIGGGEPKPLDLFVGVEKPQSESMARLPECIRQLQRTAVVDSAATACVLLPTVNINCEWDECDPATSPLLRKLPSWRGSGMNHIIWVRRTARPRALHTVARPDVEIAPGAAGCRACKGRSRPAPQDCYPSSPTFTCISFCPQDYMDWENVQYTTDRALLVKVSGSIPNA